MKTLRYSDNQPVRLGDTFNAPRWGTCTVKRFDRLNHCAAAVNTSTGEEFDNLGCDTFGESDLVGRAQSRTKVIYRTSRHKNGNTVALFPEEPHDRSGLLCVSYMHVGQHGPASPHWTDGMRPSTPDEIGPLRRELESIGYTLTPVMRCTRKMDETRRANARRSTSVPVSP